jgi:hypothetical protein
MKPKTSIRIETWRSKSGRFKRISIPREAVVALGFTPHSNDADDDARNRAPVAKLSVWCRGWRRFKLARDRHGSLLLDTQHPYIDVAAVPGLTPLDGETCKWKIVEDEIHFTLRKRADPD